MTQLSPALLRLHEQAVNLCARVRALEAEMIEILISIELEKVHRLLGYSSLFSYAVEGLRLSESNAYAFISVSRKCRECAPLRSVIGERALSVSKASRLVSVLTVENAEVLLAFAATHSARQIDQEVAKLRPKGKSEDQVKPLSKDWEKLSCAVSPEVSARLKRVQSLVSSKLGRAADFNEALFAALGAYLEKHDPVIKAERARKRAALKAGSIRPPAKTAVSEADSFQPTAQAAVSKTGSDQPTAQAGVSKAGTSRPTSKASSLPNPEAVEKAGAPQKPEAIWKNGGVRKPAAIQEPDSTQRPDLIRQPEAIQKKRAGIQKSEAIREPDVTRKPDLAQKSDVVRKPDAFQKPDVTDKPNGARKPDVVRKPEAELCTSRVNKIRIPLTAAQKHSVQARDSGRCTFVDPVTGQRCANDRWLHLHHVSPVSHGGGNEPGNLRTLCAAHHDLVHQLSLPIDYEVTWLREPQTRYG